MLADDCRTFLSFVQQRDPVVVIDRDAESSQIDEVLCPWLRGGSYCLWNQSLLPSLEREFIPQSNLGPYYRVDDALPIIEFFYPNPVQEPWNGKPALTQGRVYTGFNANKGEAFVSWYNAIVRWIRKHFMRNPILSTGGFVGPAAYDWYCNGGTLFAMLRPPITPQWLSWVEAQDQHRKVFSRKGSFTS